jgi:hypothetical protein
MTIKLNVSPYFDDYDKDKKFHRVLFRPKVPVQARELTQLQTILQEQVKRFGDHVFENKSLVIPGEIKYDDKFDWIKIDSSFNAENKEQLDAFWLNTTITGVNGVKALVVNYLIKNVDNEVVLFVKYLSGGNNGEQGKFAPGEALLNDVNALAPSVLLTSPNAEGVIGIGSAAHINEGIYYVDGFFVLVNSQTIILDAFSDRPTARVGLNVVKTIVRPEEDESIKDNALGFPSFSAPGAHRLKIDLVLTSKELNLNQSPDPEEEEDFIELMRLRQGNIVSRIDRSDYSILEKTLARRTYDESGNYTVRDFKIEIREFYRENGNNGIYEDKDFFFDTPAEAEAVAQDRFGITGWHFDPGASGKAMPGNTHSDFQEAARDLLVIGVEPGKAYVYGYEIETISKRLLDYNKAREFQHSTSVAVDTRIGNYVLVKDLNGSPDITNYSKVDLYDELTVTPGAPNGVKIGEARVRNIEFDSGVIAVDMSNALFKLHLFDIQMNSGKLFEQVKCIYQDNAPNGNGVEDFSCNINLSEIFLTGTVTQSGTALTGVGTFFQSRQSQALQPGDWIAIVDAGAGDTKKYKRIATVSTDSTATVDQSETIATASNFAFVFAELKNVGENVLLFPLSNRPIRSIRDDANDVKTVITTRREFSVVIGGGAVTLNLTDTYENFEQFDQDDYLFVKEDGPGPDPIGRVYNYNQISVSSYTPADPLIPQTSQIVFTHPDFTNGDTIRVIATLKKNGSFASQEKQKILVPGAVLNTTIGESILQEVRLGEADIIRIVKITMSNDFTTAALPSDIDVTDRYDLDNGQRDNVYDIGRILLKANSLPPTGRLRIEFDYFNHSNANKNYFSVDSYPIPYADIPSYVSAEDGLIYDLRDCLDFRPRINDAGENFDLVTGSLTEFPVKNMLVDYSYYLNRIDKLYLDATGKFIIKYGTSGISPTAPNTLENSMLLYKFETRAYTFEPQDVIQNKVDNRRYTMRHIGALENRIEKLEYYTSLTLLEKETQDLLIKDENGLDRFKNGFIVDPFEGHGIGDVRNPDYRCSVDMLEKELRPAFYQDNFRLRLDSNTNVQQYGDLLMLERSPDVVAISQLLASETMNVNPYAVFTFVGNIKLDPDNDEWKDTNTLPDLVVNIEGNYSQIEAQAAERGTVWGEWQTHWTGLEREKQVISKRDIPGPNPPDAFHKTAWPVGKEKTTRTTITKTGVQSRTGVRSTLIPEIVTENLGERVIDVSFIPFMRTRDVQFEAKGLKPNTRLYAFFDQIDVNAYVTANSSTFDAGDNILTGTPLVTDATGKCEGVFRVPGSTRAGFLDTPQGLKFRTGERVFRLTDSINNSNRFGTAGDGVYRAIGILETKQSTILSIRNARLGEEIITQNEAISNVTTNDKTKTRWVDPLAQSFLVSDTGGIYISKIGLFFNTKDANIPVTVQIREMVNGYPGPRILPFGDITIDADDILISDDASLETEFEFPSPVYIPEETEACYVVLSNSNEYHVFIARGKQNILGTEIPITQQPYGGVLFKSQNASTWTADQEADMMFKIYKAQWQAGQTGSAILVNDENDVSFGRALQNHPLQFVDGSNKVRVLHPNHSMPSIPVVQSRVKLTGIEVTSNLPVPNVAGIPLTELEDVELLVTEVSTDSYTVVVTSNADETTFAGGSQIIATQNMQMDAMQTILGEFILPETNINYGIRTTSGRGAQSPLSQEPYKVQALYSDHRPNQTVIFNTSRLVANDLNEQPAVIPGGSKTFFLLSAFSTQNPNLSPAIDTQRMSVVAIANRIDNASHTGSNSINFAPFDVEQLVSANTDVEFNATENTIEVDSDLATIQALRQIQQGRYIEITGGTLNTANTGLFRVLDVKFDSTATPQLKISVDRALVTQTGEAATVTYYKRFIDERTPQNGSALGKYVTRRFVLANPSVGLKVLAPINKPPGSDVELYYKISKIDEQGRFDDIPYQKAEWDSAIPDSISLTDFREITATINNLPDFSIVSIKLVFKGSNTALVPRVRDLRVIALGT